jgi:hypothetical protein
MPWILRILMFVAAPIAGLFVARDTLNFTILQTMITILLIVGVLILVAVWPKSKWPALTVRSSDLVEIGLKVKSKCTILVDGKPTLASWCCWRRSN